MPVFSGKATQYREQGIMKRRTFVGLLAMAILVGACGKPTKLPAIRPGKTVLAFGDSVTHGSGASAGQDWPTLLASQTGWRITNAGIPGDTAEAGKERIQALLDEYRPALVIIEIGGNDFLRRRSAKAVKEDLRRMIQAVRKAEAQVVLVAVPEFSLLGVVAGKPSDSPIYEELGDEEKIPVIGKVFADILGRPELRADQIHPNARGYQQMAAGILAYLKESGLAAAGGS
jgi:acyl-CoA hydrolase